MKFIKGLNIVEIEFRGEKISDHIPDGWKISYLSQQSEVYVIAHRYVSWLLRPLKTFYYTIIRLLRHPLDAFESVYELRHGFEFTDWGYWKTLGWYYWRELVRFKNLIKYVGSKILRFLRK